MPKLKSQCPVCQAKNVQETSFFVLGGSKFITLNCGHTYTEDLEISEEETLENLTFLTGKKPYKFQIEGIKFAERSGFSCLIADKQGLGKTIQALGIVKLHLEKLKPIACIVKASLSVQWQKYFFREIGKFAPILTSDKKTLDFFLGQDIYICSFDTVAKIDWDKINPKTIIVDECQYIKSHDAKRTNAVRSLLSKEIKENERLVKHKIFLSGTPILNNMIEYFPTLNMLRPNLYPNRDEFIRNKVGYYQDRRTGKYKPGGAKYPKEFQEEIKDFIIRRTKLDTGHELPEITRDFRYFQISTEENKAYGLGIKKLSEFLRTADTSNAFQFSAQLQGHIFFLRHIVGLAKVNPTVEFIEEFLENNAAENGTPADKLAIFHHHVDVGNTIEKKITVPYVRITAADSPARKYEKLTRFREDPECQIMIAPTLAMGEGYDLEFCGTGILLEREWNPAKEGQVEGRFIRATPESIEKIKKGELHALMIYPTAVDTVDEDLAELVEVKRYNLAKTLDGHAEIEWNETEVMRDLAEIAVRKWESKNGKL